MKKQLKNKILPLIMIFMILFTAFPQAAFAGEGDLHQASDLNQFKSVLSDEMMNTIKNINIQYSGSERYTTREDASAAWSENFLETEKSLVVPNKNNRLRATIGYTFKTDVNGKWFVDLINYQMDYKHSKAELVELSGYITSIVNENITSEMNDYEKIKAAYQYTINILEYGFQQTDGNIVGLIKERNVLGALKDGNAVVCDAYAFLLERILTEMGFENHFVVGKILAGNVGHAWNLVKLNGNWYHLDATWGDMDKQSRFDQYRATYPIATYPSATDEYLWNIVNNEAIQAELDNFLKSDSNFGSVKFWVGSDYPNAVSNFVLPDETAAIANATASVTSAETAKTIEGYNSALALVKKLLSGSEKTQLNNRLVNLQIVIAEELVKAQAITTATASVTTAEISANQSAIDNARILVNALVDSSEKTQLISRLDIVQQSVTYKAKINTIKAAISNIRTASEQPTIVAMFVDITAEDLATLTAQLNNKISSLTTTTVATFQKLLKDANDKMGVATIIKRPVFITMAQNAINALPESPEKTALLAEFQTKFAGIGTGGVATFDFKPYERSVKLSEQLLRTTYFDAARIKVLTLTDGVEKEAYLERITLAEMTKTTAEKTAYVAMIKAETYKTTAYASTYIAKANTLVNALSDSAVKTLLTSRMAAMAQ